MLPEPIHPVIVHFPIVLVTLLPVVALVALYAIRRGAAPRRAWAGPLAVALLLALSSFVAVRTGEAQEERVEEVVTESALHTHEEAGERFLVLSGVLALVAVTGLVGGTAGRAARAVSTAGAFLLVIAGVQVGGSGGDLVYTHGAANAYVQPATGPEARPQAEIGVARPDDAEEDDDEERGG